MHEVLIVGMPNVQALDIVGPSDVFTTASHLLAERSETADGYHVTLASLGGAPVDTGTGLAFLAVPLPEPEGVDTLVLPGGPDPAMAAHRYHEDLVTWVRTAATSVRRIVSVCTGAFLAAEAGLLDDRQATTHWACADRLAARYPRVHVDAERMFVRSSEQVWTAGGVSAGIDLALALVEADCGVDIAKAVARRLVLHLRRAGGQIQFADPFWRPRAKHGSIRTVQEAIEASPAESHSIAELAHRAAMSPRHFTRVFTQQVGEPPGAYVERTRINAARRLLEESTETLPTIAARCGFGSAETLRRNFVQRIGLSPDAYRRAFA